MSEAPDVPSDVIAAWERILERLRAAVFGEFEILREIGSGGMAAVYLARQIALNRQVAIKVMSPA
jgi:serine/threonine protein kinase